MPKEDTRTNIEKVTEFMDFVAMGQFFVIDCITQRAQYIIDNEEEVRKDWPPMHFINVDAWIDAAKKWFEQNPKLKRQ
jgi:hypothetical protein